MCEIARFQRYASTQKRRPHSRTAPRPRARACRSGCATWGSRGPSACCARSDIAHNIRTGRAPWPTRSRLARGSGNRAAVEPTDTQQRRRSPFASTQTCSHGFATAYRRRVAITKATSTPRCNDTSPNMTTQQDRLASNSSRKHEFKRSSLNRKGLRREQAVGNETEAVACAARARLVVHSNFTIELVSVKPYIEKQTCRTCGWVTTLELPAAMGASVRFAAYRNQGAGVSGRCDGCTKRKRDERYPLKCAASK